VRSRATENVLSQRLGGIKALECYWTYVAEDFEYPRLDGGRLVLAAMGRRDENVMKSGTLFWSGSL